MSAREATCRSDSAQIQTSFSPQGKAGISLRLLHPNHYRSISLPSLPCGTLVCAKLEGVARSSVSPWSNPERAQLRCWDRSCTRVTAGAREKACMCKEQLARLPLVRAGGYQSLSTLTVPLVHTSERLASSGSRDTDLQYLHAHPAHRTRRCDPLVGEA